jgi:hypothetical protein
MNAKTIIACVILVIITMLSVTRGLLSLPGVVSRFETAAQPTGLSYPIVDTGQGKCYDDQAEIACPAERRSFNGQDAQYAGNTPRYHDNGDGTVSDLVTGLMWQKDPGEKMTYSRAVAGASTLKLAGYKDWRLPSIKELYSLILFDGTDPSGCPVGTCSATPFIDTRYFGFQYGDTGVGERTIDSQFASSTKYVSTTMNGAESMFGVNFADGRIKGYPTGPMARQSSGKLFFVLYVRGNKSYGVNAFADNRDGTITDDATGLIWMQSDSGKGMTWADALAFCENSSAAGHSDWRLPSAKELQSIVDYSRSPATTGSAAIDPLFNVSTITGEEGKSDYPFYWSSTTHAGSDGDGRAAVYLSFGEAMGYMHNVWMDVHGAGAQRSDPKTGNPAAFPTGRGPQGDAIRINNHVRCVRGGIVRLDVDGNSKASRPSMTFELTGIQQPPMGGRRRSGPHGRRPPQEAIDACSGRTRGADCAFVAPNGTRIKGTCGPVQEQLACIPSGGPPKR